MDTTMSGTGKALVTPLQSKIWILDTGKKVQISDENRRRIGDNWKKLTGQNPRMFSGPIYSVDKVEENAGEIVLTCSLSDYAHYRYSEEYDLGDEACRNVYGSCLVVTKDNYVAVALNGKGSEFDGKIQVIGGGVEPIDREPQTNCLDSEKTALRELREEAGEEIRNSIKHSFPGFLISDSKKFGVITIGSSSLQMTELKKAFKRYKEKSGNDEIDTLVFFRKDRLMEVEKYVDRQDLGVVEMIRKYFEITE